MQSTINPSSSHWERSQPVGPARAAYSVAETAEMLGLCEASIYRALKRGDLVAVMLGGRRLIPARCIDKLLAAEAA
jgi:excisionase family DNA binding protein